MDFSVADLEEYYGVFGVKEDEWIEYVRVLQKRETNEAEAALLECRITLPGFKKKKGRYKKRIRDLRERIIPANEQYIRQFLARFQLTA